MTSTRPTNSCTWVNGTIGVSRNNDAAAIISIDNCIDDYVTQGSKRDKQLDATKADLASGDPEREATAWRRRQRMEDEAAKKSESRLREAIQSIMHEALSKATEDKIRKKAKERGMTFGSMKAEYKKGLAAWGSSGSRPGVSQHAWAMARINKANPSDDWSVVKKSKAKK